MKTDLSKKIVEDLEKVGFPAEVLISTDLDKASWMVYNGALFEDKEEGKSREIDVHAVYVDFSFIKKVPAKTKAGGENKLISHLVVEVKKTTKPWIFFDNGRMNWPQVQPENFKSEHEEFHDLLFDDLKAYGMKTHRYKDAILHKSYHVSFSNPSEQSVIYEALIKTSKALDYFKEHYGMGQYVIHLFTPIIVIDGSLWTATLNKDKKVKVKEVNSLFVVFSHLTKDNRLNMAFEEEQICEVVTLKSFKKHLTIIEKDNKEIYKAWTRFINTLK